MLAMTYSSLVNDITAYLDRTDASLQAQIPNFIGLGEIRCAREVKNLGLKQSVVGSFTPGQYAYIKPNRWLETISINFGNSTAYNTVSREAAAGTRTLTLETAHDFSVNDSISVFNLGGTGYNGNFTVSAITELTVSYLSGSENEAETPDSGGIATAPLEDRTYLAPRAYEYCCAYWPNRTEKGIPKFYSDYNYDNFFIVPTPKIANPFEIVFFQKPIPLSETNQTNWFTDHSPDLLLYATLLEAVPYLKNDARIQTWKDYYLQAVTAIKTENKERINDGTMKRVEE